MLGRVAKERREVDVVDLAAHAVARDLGKRSGGAACEHARAGHRAAERKRELSVRKLAHEVGALDLLVAELGAAHLEIDAPIEGLKGLPGQVDVEVGGQVACQRRIAQNLAGVEVADGAFGGIADGAVRRRRERAREVHGRAVFELGVEARDDVLGRALRLEADRRRAVDLDRYERPHIRERERAGLHVEVERQRRGLAGQLVLSTIRDLAAGSHVALGGLEQEAVDKRALGVEAARRCEADGHGARRGGDARVERVDDAFEHAAAGVEVRHPRVQARNAHHRIDARRVEVDLCRAAPDESVLNRDGEGRGLGRVCCRVVVRGGCEHPVHVPRRVRVLPGEDLEARKRHVFDGDAFVEKREEVVVGEHGVDADDRLVALADRQAEDARAREEAAIDPVDGRRRAFVEELLDLIDGKPFDLGAAPLRPQQDRREEHDAHNDPERDEHPAEHALRRRARLVRGARLRRRGGMGRLSHARTFVRCSGEDGCGYSRGYQTDQKRGSC